MACMDRARVRGLVEHLASPTSMSTLSILPESTTTYHQSKEYSYLTLKALQGLPKPQRECSILNKYLQSRHVRP